LRAASRPARRPRLRREIVRLEDLSRDRREALVDELYAVHRQVFGGADREQFAEEVFADEGRRTRIQIFRGPDGAAVGYCAAHRYDRDFLGRQSAIFKAEAGLLPAWRGGAACWRFGFMSALRFKLLHPLRPVLYIGMLVHPSSYCLLAERFPVVLPGRSRPVPPDAARAMAAFADDLGELAVAGDPLLRRVEWITLQNEAETEMWRASRHPDARFYRERNPDFGQGVGLLTLVPLTAVNLAGALANHLILKLPVMRRLRGLSRLGPGGRGRLT
jgi:hypothetical protein